MGFKDFKSEIENRTPGGRSHLFSGNFVQRSLIIFNPVLATQLSKELDRRVFKRMVRLRPIDREIVRMEAMGHYRTHIGIAIGRTDKTVRQRMKKPELREALEELEMKQDVELLETKQRIRAMVSKALDVLDKKMESQDERIALSAANSVLDRDPDAKKVSEQQPLAVLSPEGLREMAQVLREVKGEVFGDGVGTSSKTDSENATGICGTA
jgi:hypothetical protein